MSLARVFSLFLIIRGDEQVDKEVYKRDDDGGQDSCPEADADVWEKPDG